MDDVRRELDAELAGKYEALRGNLHALGRVAVAFSAGVDSTLLLAVAHEVLGEDVLAVTARAPFVPAREATEAREFCRQRGIAHMFVEPRVFDVPGFSQNPPNRCYLCKKELLSSLVHAAAERGFPVVVEGSNVDDDADYRPGAEAVRELHVASPLRDAGLAKADVRALARHLGLAEWDKPANACLNTRFAFGDLLTPERLAMVDAAEEALHDMGFVKVRVRTSGVEGAFSVRIELLPEDIARACEPGTRERIVSALEGVGYSAVAVDLRGYRMGSMNVGAE